MKLNKKISGYLAKKQGDLFERVLHANAQKTNWMVIRIPDGCKQLTMNKLIRVQTPFDFVFLKSVKHATLTQRFSVFADAKSTKEDTFKFSSIKSHQLKSLMDIHSLGFKSGYVVNFRELNTTVFFEANQLFSLEKRKSLKPSDGIRLGTSTEINLGLIFV